MRIECAMTDDVLFFLTRRNADKLSRRRLTTPLVLLPSPIEVRRLRIACREAATRVQNAGRRYPVTLVDVAADPERQTPAYQEPGWLIYHNHTGGLRQTGRKRLTGGNDGREVMLFFLGSGNLAFVDDARNGSWSLSRPPSRTAAVPYHLADHERRLPGTDIVLLPIPRVLIALIEAVFVQPDQTVPVPARVIGRAAVPLPVK